MSMVLIIRAVLISSLAALPTSLIFLGYEGSVPQFLGWGWTVLMVFLVALVGCIVVGLPLHFIMQRRHINCRLAYAVVGFLAPIIILAMGPILTMDYKELVNHNNIEIALVLAVAGSAVSVALRETTQH